MPLPACRQPAVPLLGETLPMKPMPSNVLLRVFERHSADQDCSSKSPWRVGYLMLPAAEDWPSIPLMLTVRCIRVHQTKVTKAALRR